MNTETCPPLLVVRELKKYFQLGRLSTLRQKAVARAVDGVSFSLERGKVLGLVGESGCGKTTVGRVILRLIEPTSGRVILGGQDVTAASRKQLKDLRRRMQIVFQDPYSSLDPRMSVYRILKEPLDNFQPGLKRRQKKDLVVDALEKVGLTADHLSRFPHEFSGGQRQRIAVARSLIPKPDLIICDEPVSALDVSIQAQVINLLRKLQLELGLAIVLISHDLAVVQHLSDALAVMYLGRIIEMSASRDLYRNPLHPYTKALISAAPIPDPLIERRRKQEVPIEDVPNPIHVPSGCSYHPRCSQMENDCCTVQPALVERTPGHLVACFKAGGSG